MPRYIDADALKAKYEQMLPEIGDGYHKETLQDVLFELDYAPTISPDDVRGVGEWERINYTVGHDYKCLACGKLNDRASNYCPDCGKPMRMKGADA